MQAYQTQVIEAQIALLWHVRQTHENELTTNQVCWIDDDITYVEVKYLNKPDDSTRAEEYRIEGPARIGFLDAQELLAVRLKNTLEYLA